MRILRVVLVVAAVAGALMVGCRPARRAQPSEPEPAPAPEPEPEPERPVPSDGGAQGDAGPLEVPSGLAKAINHFGVDLWRQMGARQGNLAVSPASISTALAMTYGGARGETAEQMAKTLHFGSDAEALHRDAEAFVKSISDPGQRPYSLHVANRLFGEKTFTFEEPFLALTRDRYGAELEPVDFVGAAEASRVHINSWVKGQTRDRIVDLLPPPAITRDTRLVLVNALYFNGPWMQPFREAATQPAAFHLSATESVEVPTMHQIESFRYGEAEGVRIVTLPYAGGELAMTIVLPVERDGLAAVERSMSAATVEGWLSAATESKRLALSLPRFTIQPEESLQLKPALEALGMPLAFVRGRADFTGMASPPDPDDRLNIDDVYHRAFVEVTEEGTEAAAATAVVMARAGGVPSEPPAFDVDHPFLFFIHDWRSDAILFMGRLVDPR